MPSGNDRRQAVRGRQWLCSIALACVLVGAATFWPPALVPSGVQGVLAVQQQAAAAPAKQAKAPASEAPTSKTDDEPAAEPDSAAENAPESEQDSAEPDGTEPESSGEDDTAASPQPDVASDVASDAEPDTASDAAPKAASDAPQKAPDAKAAKQSINLFGTLELKSRIKNMPKWQTVISKELKTPSYTDKRQFEGKGSWPELKAKFAQLEPLQQLQAVNAFINRWPYKTDMQVWGVEDFWATPGEFFRRSGDCEDYAIAKYYALRQLGIPASNMRVVVLMDTLRRLAHAVLVVYSNGDALILDNLSNSVLSHRRYSNYKPQFSVNEEFRWTHLSPNKAASRK